MTQLVQTMDDDYYDNYKDDDDQPTEYIYGDVELKIINTRGMVNNRGFFFNYLGSKTVRPGVDIVIRLHNKTMVCSNIFCKLDDSTGQHHFQMSLAHPLESKVRVCR